MKGLQQKAAQVGRTLQHMLKNMMRITAHTKNQHKQAGRILLNTLTGIMTSAQLTKQLMKATLKDTPRGNHAARCYQPLRPRGRRTHMAKLRY